MDASQSIVKIFGLLTSTIYIYFIISQGVVPDDIKV